MKIIDRKFLKSCTPTCHAGTIAFYKDKPIFSWFGGSREGAPDCSIYIQCPNKVVKISNNGIPHWNPILFPIEDKLFIFIKSGLFCDRWQTFILDISNILEYEFDIENVPIQILPAGLNGPVKTKPIFKDGLIHCGSSVETIYDWTAYKETYVYDRESGSLVFANRTPPMVVDKKYYNDIYGIGQKQTMGIIQPSLWVDKSGNMNAFYRSSRGLGRIYYSISKDSIHEMWSAPAPTKFNNPNSGVDTVYVNGRLFLVYNPDEQNRYPLVINELEDEMFEVIDEIIIAKNIPEDERVYSPELSYPYMIEHGGKLHLVYTHGRTKISYAEIEI